MNNDKIEIFILTYNRCDLLEAAIRSVLNQTVPAKLTVVDNHSTDGTMALVEKINAEGHDILFVERKENGGWPGNFETAKQYMTKPYVMLFSDDDILHPRYVEFALRVLDVEKNISLICSATIPFYDSQVPCVEDCTASGCLSFDDEKNFASYVFAAQIIRPWETPLFPNIIYRREYLINAVALDPLFGKISDRPFIINGVGAGRAALICEPMLYYRLHGGSDSQNRATACSVGQLFNWLDYFRTKMGRSLCAKLIYALCAGRCLKAYSNFACLDQSPLNMLGCAWRTGRISIASLPMLAERCLHLVGVKTDCLFERLTIFLAQARARRKLL